MQTSFCPPLSIRSVIFCLLNNLLIPIFIDKQNNPPKPRFQKWNSDEFFFEKEYNQDNVFFSHEPKFDENCYFSDLAGGNEGAGPTQDLSPNSTGNLGYPRNVFEWGDCNVRNFKFSCKTPSVINSRLSEKEAEIPQKMKKKEDLEAKVEQVTSETKAELSPGNSAITDALDRLFNRNESKKPSKKYSVDLAVRKDVVNKNMFRIISRFYKHLMAQHFPQFKSALRNVQELEELLENFCSMLFPEVQDDKLKYTLGALCIAPKMKILDVSTEVKLQVSQIHKVLSKYTHKDMQKLESIPTFGLIYSNFSLNGMEFFQEEETVQKHTQVYFKALNELKTKFIPQGAFLPMSL